MRRIVGLALLFTYSACGSSGSSPQPGDSLGGSSALGGDAGATSEAGASLGGSALGNGGSLASGGLATAGAANPEAGSFSWGGVNAAGEPNLGLGGVITGGKSALGGSESVLAGAGGFVEGGEAGAAGAIGGYGGEPSNGGSGGTLTGQGGTLGQGGTTSQGGKPSSGGTASQGGASGGSVGSGGAAPACDASAAPEGKGLALTTAVFDANLGGVVYATQPPGSSDWYLVDQRGRIRVWANGALRASSFLDVTSEVALGTGDFSGAAEYDDRGLVGLAFAPDYAQSGLFYVAISPNKSGAEDFQHRQIREYRRSVADAYVAEPTRVRTIFDAPANNNVAFGGMHNLSTVQFGPDGLLYAAIGDGGTASCNAAQPDEPQKIDSVYGKILRLDPRKALAPYAADGNPFAANGDARVLHYGVRNPYRFNIDSATGDLYFGDVGQFSYEEQSFAPASAKGLNFGWAAFEGNTNTCTNRQLRAGSVHTPPIFVADRRSSGCTGLYCDYQASVGGAVYRGSSIPQLEGALLFGDVYGKRMNLLFQCGNKTSPVRVIRKECDPNYPNEACFARIGGGPNITRLMAIVEGNDHELYLVVNRNRLYKVVAQ